MGRNYRAEYYPSDTMEICEDNLHMFFNFMYKRHLIWYRRYVGKLPKEKWTNDNILKEFKYTNIYRELDRGTVWYLDTIAKEYEESNKTEIDFKTLIWKTIIYRLCNRIETFEEVGFPDYNDYDASTHRNEYANKLDVIYDRGQPIVTSAHLTCPTRGGLLKYEGFVEAINSLYSNLTYIVGNINTQPNLRSVFGLLQTVFCVGAFTAYEVICDLMYTKSIHDNEGNIYKEDDWANVGPGAKEGIRLIFPSTTGNKSIYERMVQLRDEQHEHFETLEIDFPWYERFTKGHLSLRGIEHSLCEFSKFWLQKKGLGKKRMIFKPNSNRIVCKTLNGKQLQYRVMLDDTGERIKYVYY